MLCLGTWLSGGLGNTGLIVGFDDLKGPLQPEWLCDFMIASHLAFIRALWKKVYQSQMHVLFILHVKWLVNCKRKSSVGRKCQEQCGLCRKTLSCILNSKDRKVLNRWWLTVYSLPVAPNGEGSLRYTKQNAQAVVLAAPGFWVLRFTICIAIHIKLVLSGEKKKRRQ